MVRKTDKSHRRFAESEIGTIRKDWKGRIRVALVYPNRYYVGMSNLGFQAVYHLLNQIDYVLCERSFLPEKNGCATDRITTIESGRPISDFDIIAFSLSFENDYLNLLTILERAGIPLQSSRRKDIHPLIITGGGACFLNPEPIAPFIDCFLIGEAEAMLPRFFEVFLPKLLKTDKKSHLKDLAENVPGVYVPCFYKITYNRDGTICSFEPTCDVEDISHIPTCSAILTPHTTFQRTFLIEVSRGCPHGCRFCAAGYIYRPPRFRSLSLLKKCLKHGASLTDRIGLVGAAVSDHPGIIDLCRPAQQMDIRISFSSLRADALAPELISALRQSNVKTATIAPDAGSERMRKVINKNITEEDILKAAETLVLGGIPNLKLYFMIGLPTETEDDVEEIIKLCVKIKQWFLESSRIKKHIGQITVSLNPFVPKPFTPFQWVAMDDERTLKKKIKRVKDGLKKVANIMVNAESPRHAYIQALFSRGDRKLAKILSMANHNHGNWAKTLKSTDLNPDFYALRDRALDELLPWDFIDHGIRKTYLKREYKRALQGKMSEACKVESCTVCGVCKKK
ncbi:MAG: TIGR03960 family B12-binding radical SAM protein [Desulfobacterales bacterium]|uniref:TIGR03960 family B12-binding radical SAM protein n=1 Tax=Candidatus Desulfaltia bathyphila TaxID=2841697 RepID=A0A8J6N4Z7_9BACT|nr:TIGR03960 family B12-binding radical SAM protein [Candidatus Desulfaltia bathyphila]MBL7195731.1 TIGR03960 family B12-binding radical SAM protein [Desulfobacterales bacterium]MBL7207402.1 TIGR03960 family B12-binding radical SAM protein [Desulfobacterales bacterium]